MAQRFLSGTLRGKPLSAYRTTRREMAAVLGVIFGVGSPLMLGAVWFLAYRLAHVPAQPNETLVGFVGLMALALALTDRALRRVMRRGAKEATG